MSIDIISYLTGQQAGGSSPSGEIEITENGEYDVTNYATATVNVASGGDGTIPMSNINECLIDKGGVIINA